MSQSNFPTTGGFGGLDVESGIMDTASLVSEKLNNHELLEN